MLDIYTYYDYHKFLQDFYDRKKAESPCFSYRYISSKVGIDHALVVKIFSGKRDISANSIPAFARLLELSSRQAEYFELLILYGKSKTDHEIKHYFEKMLSFSSVGGRQVTIDQYEFYQKWYYTALRELINIHRFRNEYDTMAGFLDPPITPLQTRKGIELLLRLGLITKNSKRYLEQTDAFISTGENWKSTAVKTFQKETLGLAVRALEVVPKERRDISTVTLTLNDDGLEQARERIKQFQKDLFTIAAACDKVDAVYQVNLQVFPLSRKSAKDKSV